jgi:hypothetical protein
VWKIAKALAVVAVLFLLFRRSSPISQYSLPKIPWVLIFVLTLTCGISLIFSSEISAHRRFAAAYLIFTGFTYLLAGILGLLPSWGLIEAAMWHSLLSPYVFISFLDQLFYHFPYTVAKAPYEWVPHQEHHVFSAIVMAISAVAVVAAFGMAKGSKIACNVWLVLLGLLILAFLGYVIVGFVSWGLKDIILPLCWLGSYIAAYMVVRRGMINYQKSNVMIRRMKGGRDDWRRQTIPEAWLTPDPDYNVCGVYVGGGCTRSFSDLARTSDHVTDE